MANKHQKEVFEANETLQKSEAFFEKNKKPVLIGLLALIIIVAGFFIYKSQVAAPRAEKASTALAKGQEYFNQEMFEQALNGDNAGYVGFVKIASDYSGTDAGNLANLYAGLCYANLNKWQDAQKYLDSYSTAGDMMVSPAAVAALGNAYAHLNQVDKAVDKLKKAANMADGRTEDGVNNSISPTFLLQAGILLESQDKKDEALKIYQDIKKTYLNSAIVQSGEIDKYIERVSVK